MIRTHTLQRLTHRGGFTLIELMISLTAGLVVTLGVAGLAHEISNTFNEETRLSAAEAGVRTGIDRLRADLQRAAFQSTGNIALDFVQGCQCTTYNTFTTITNSFPAMRRLAGIHLYDGTTQEAMPDENVPPTLALSASNGLAPDAIDIGGNMTSLDWFEAYEPKLGIGVNGCTRIYIRDDTLAVYRILQAAAANQGTLLRNLFQPTDPAGTDGSAQFMVRFVDAEAHSWFLATCPTSATAGIQMANTYGNRVWVDVATTPVVGTKTACNSLCGTVGNTGAPNSFINPVQVVRWQLEQDVAGADGLNPEKSSTKYDLTRTFIDAVSAKQLMTTKEHVVDYAVDLKFAVNYDSESAGLPVPTPQLVQYQLDDTLSATVAPDVSLLTLTSGTGPQRIRSVLVRLAAREGFADRSATLPVSLPGQYNTTTKSNPQTYLFRYSLGGTGATPFARVRTLVTEVALPNQTSLYY